MATGVEQNGRPEAGGVRVICLDPHELMLAGLAARLSTTPGIRAVALLQDSQLLLQAVRQWRPGVVLAEIDNEGAPVFSMIARLSRFHASIRTLVFSAHSSPACVRAALAAGAVGYFSKADPADELIRAVRSAPGATEPLLGTSIRAGMAGAEGTESTKPEPALALLTPREIEVLCLIGRGLSRVEIAESIGRSPKTVDAHRLAIMGKLGFKDRVHLARFAIREGLVSV